MHRDLSFSTGERVHRRGRLLLMTGSLVIVVACFCWVRLMGVDSSGSVPVSMEIVEVSGDVPQPGVYRLGSPMRLHSALRAAGLDEFDEMPNDRIEPGTRIVVSDGSYRTEELERPLVVGLPVDLNRASEESLLSIPGIGPARARAILDERTRGGDFHSIADLERVHGFGPTTIEDLRHFLTVED